jgi:pimeloyl-ACP methyl ester carboxylesterase
MAPSLGSSNVPPPSTSPSPSAAPGTARRFGSGASRRRPNHGAGAPSQWRRARSFARRVQAVEPAAPIPPPLPDGRIINVPGIGEVFARVSAPMPDAVPVLLLHGWTVSADLNWFRVYSELAATRQVIAVDHQGHGRGVRSEQPFSLERCADAADGVLEHLGIERAIVAGYSMGGPISLLLAHRHPDRVAGLVLGATALEWRARPLERLQWRFLPVLELLTRFTTGKGIAQRVVRQAMEDDPSLEVWRPWLVAEMQRGYVPDVLNAGRALAAYDARPWAGEITAPAAVVLTTNDRLVRPRKQRQLAERLHATVHEIPGDHDAPLVLKDHFGPALELAIDDVARHEWAARSRLRSTG